MTLRSWIQINCKFAEIEEAAPHLVLRNPSTGQDKYFDAGAECVSEPCIPSNWAGSKEDWDSYSQFLKEFYSTDDPKEVFRHLTDDAVIPIWNDGKIEMVCRGDDEIFRPCDQRKHNPQSAQELKI